MQGNLFVISLSQPGTLTTNAVKRVSFPFGVTLTGGNCYTDNATGFDLDVGTASDTDAYIDAHEVIGSTGTTIDIGISDLVNDTPIHIAAGTEIVITADFDATGSADAANIDVHLFFREG